MFNSIDSILAAFWTSLQHVCPALSSFFNRGSNILCLPFKHLYFNFQHSIQSWSSFSKIIRLWAWESSDMVGRTASVLHSNSGLKRPELVYHSKWALQLHTLRIGDDQTKRVEGSLDLWADSRRVSVVYQIKYPGVLRNGIVQPILGRREWKGVSLSLGNERTSLQTRHEVVNFTNWPEQALNVALRGTKCPWTLSSNGWSEAFISRLREVFKLRKYARLYSKRFKIDEQYAIALIHGGHHFFLHNVIDMSPWTEPQCLYIASSRNRDETFQPCQNIINFIQF